VTDATDATDATDGGATDARDGAAMDASPCDGGSCGSYTIRAGSHSACALRRPSGEIWCWGENGFGQLGRGVRSLEDGGASGLANPAPVVDAMGAPLRGFAGLTVGAGMACAYNTSNQVFCWGRNSELWTDDERTEVLRPSRVSLFDTLPSMGAIVEISTIVGAVFVRYANGAVVSFGSRYNSAVADGLEGQPMASPLRSPEVGPVAGLASVRSVSSTYTNVGYAVAASGALLGWGRDSNGRFGTLVGSMVEPGRPVVTVPTVVPGVTGAVSAAATVNFGCALDETGAVRCWGYNADFAVDPTQPIGAVIRTPVRRLDIGSSTVAIATAGPAVLALDGPTGVIRCFGGTYENTCPTGPGMGAASTVRGFDVAAPRIVELAGGFDFACARASDQRVWCWGRNESRQCASTTATMVPATAPFLVPLPPP
jgi:alpha-tubulin suppressor-like RCC1 family protein